MCPLLVLREPLLALSEPFLFVTPMLQMVWTCSPGFNRYVAAEQRGNCAGDYVVFLAIRTDNTVLSQREGVKERNVEQRGEGEFLC